MLKNLVMNGEIILEGEVIDDDFAEWGYPGFCPAQVRDALAEFGSGPVTVRLNSIGGFAFEGETIRALLSRHPGAVTLIIEGSAQSSASLLALGADRIEISAGSFVMIHDPVQSMGGTAAEHRQAAEALDVVASGYAAVYAARLGIAVDEARALMVAETYWSAPEAVAIGFADAISGDVQAIAASASHDLAALRARAARVATARAAQYEKFKAGGTSPKPHQPDADGVTQEENEKMSKTPEQIAALAAAPVAPTPVTAVAPDNAAIQAAARAAERARIGAIRAAGAPFVASGALTEADIAGFIDSDATAEAAKAAMLDRVSEKQAATASGPRAQILRDEGETKIEGMIAAMSGKTDGPAADYRGLRVKSLARMLGGSGGAGGYNEAAIIKRGMGSTAIMAGAHGVSDFAYITSEVMGRMLANEYTRRAATWQNVTGAPMQAADFRELAPTTFGGDFSLKEVAENGEYKTAVLSDRGEGFKVTRKGRQIILTFEAVMNDDMGAFARIPNQFALAARQMESSMVWSLIRTNAKLKSDNTAFFIAAHGNLATAAAISVASVGAGRKLMWDQKAQGAKAEDDFIQVTPDLLIVPPALETVALQFAAGTTPATDATTNPYKNTMTVVVVPELGAAVTGGSDTAWYLGSSDMPAIAAAYLDGFEGPSVQIDEGMSPDRVVMNARHIFGAGTSEPRGMVKNPGA